MIKLIEVIGRRLDLTHAQFIEHLSTTHLQVVDRVPEFRNRVQAYTQNHLLVDPDNIASVGTLPITANADAIIEVWWKDVAEIQKAFEEPRYMEVIRPDELSFGDVAGAWGVLALDTTLMERSGFCGLEKMFIFLKRKPEVDRLAFYNRWRDTRERLLLPSTACRDHVGRFVENRAAGGPAESMPGMRAFDLVVELWFDSPREITEFGADRDVVAAIVGAGADFVDRSRTSIYVGRENPAASEWLRRGMRG
jgi:hypothetical protein